MSQDPKRRFGFTSGALAPDTFEVVSFTGREGLSTLFTFDVTVVATKDAIDPEAVITAPATLTLDGQNGTFAYHGIAVGFEQAGKVHDYTFYRFTLAPRPFLLTLGENCRIFLDMTPEAFIAEVLRTEGLRPGVDFELRLGASAPSRDFVAQFRESSFAFVSRWLERNGWYYFFEQSAAGARMVITDSKSVHQPMPGKNALRYETPSGMVPDTDGEAVFDLRHRLRPVPASVLLKDWNYETPSVNLEAQAQVLDQGRGAMRLFGDHFRTPDEGRTLAKVRAEELLCRRDTIEGQTGFPGLTAGRTFTLDNHFLSALNRDYLVTEVRHEGRQFAFLTTGLGLSHAPDGAPETYYRNSFVAMPSDVQYRAERKTPWPRQEGLVNAVIDGAGSETHPEVDDGGRYKIKLAYDRSGREGGKASSWVRMAQPYGGADHGLHCPLHKGCEVAVACHDGDPDRPVILGAVPNPEHKSVVTSGNQTKSVLQTSANNLVSFEDMEGSQRILMQSTANETYLRLGTPNDPWLEKEKGEGESGVAYKGHGIDIVCGSSMSTYMIGYFESIAALQIFNFATKTSLNVLFTQEYIGHTTKFWIKESEFGFIAERLNASETQVNASKQQLADQLIAVRGQLDTLNTALQKINTDYNVLTGQMTTLGGNVTTLSQEKAKICAQMTTMAQDKNRLSVANTKLAADVQKLAQAKIDLSTEVTELAAQVDELAQEATHLETERTELFTQLSQLGEAYSQMCDTDLTL